MGELGRLVEMWRDGRDPKPADAWIGAKVGVKSRSSVRPWLDGESMPKPEPLRRLASLIGVGYRRALDAALLDAGYLEEREYRGDTAPMTTVRHAVEPVPISDNAAAQAELDARREILRADLDDAARMPHASAADRAEHIRRVTDDYIAAADKILARHYGAERVNRSEAG